MTKAKLWEVWFHVSRCGKDHPPIDDEELAEFLIDLAEFVNGHPYVYEGGGAKPVEEPDDE